MEGLMLGRRSADGNANRHDSMLTAVGCQY